jgi:predicted flap endonuclease-1-like 5' DNA nuclease
MNFWTTLLLGILIGWLIEWVIDWVYWRNKTAQPVVADKTVELKAAQEKNAVLTSKLEHAQEKIAALEAELEECGDITIDPLEKIKGIGPVIKKKLNDGGVFSFKQLGKLTPANLEAIVGDDIKRLADEDEIIRQAKEFAQKG